MAAKAGRSLCLALVLFEAARASQPGGPGAGGFQGGSYGYGGVPPQQQEQQQQQRRDQADGYTGTTAVSFTHERYARMSEHVFVPRSAGRVVGWL